MELHTEDHECSSKVNVRWFSDYINEQSKSETEDKY